MSLLLHRVDLLFSVTQDGRPIEEYARKFLELPSTVCSEDAVLMDIFHRGLDEPLYSKMPSGVNRYTLYALLLSWASPERPLILPVISKSVPVKPDPESTYAFESTPAPECSHNPFQLLSPVSVSAPDHSLVIVPAPEHSTKKALVVHVTAVILFCCCDSCSLLGFYGIKIKSLLLTLNDHTGKFISHFVFCFFIIILFRSLHECLFCNMLDVQKKKRNYNFSRYYSFF